MGPPVQGEGSLQASTFCDEINKQHAPLCRLLRRRRLVPTWPKYERSPANDVCADVCKCQQSRRHSTSASVALVAWKWGPMCTQGNRLGRAKKDHRDCHKVD